MDNKTEQKYIQTLQKASVRIKDLMKQVESLKKKEPIAVIGMACRFPGGADTPEKFWEILEKGVDTVTEVPPDRWDAEKYYDPDPEVPGKIYTAMGGFLDSPIDRFDASFFNISPKEASRMDPQQRLLLEVSWEAVENSGLNAASLKGSNTGVFIGISGDDYSDSRKLPQLYDKINAYSITGTTFSTAAGRISYVYGFEGPCMAVDTACSSSLVCLHLACRSLQLGESDAAMVCGVMLNISPGTHICFSKLQAISPDGKCKSFDASADGYVRGEGCGVIMLKRLSDALKDGNSVLAVIKGSAVNQDGKSNGLTAPNGIAQQKVIREALKDAGISPAAVGFIEAHGTGTALGDPIEVESVGTILNEGHSKKNPLLIGSVKTNIGHLESASGIAALMKVILSFQHEAIPPNLHFNTPSPYIPWEDFPIKVPTRVTPWPQSDTPRIAGINSFGFSGTNAHVLIEDFRLKTECENHFSHFHLLPLSAKNESALTEIAAKYAEYLSDEASADITDICRTASIGRTHFEHRLAIVGKSKEEVKNNLLKAEPLTPHPSPLTFLFPGQGAQYVGMGRTLYETQPLFREALDKCDELLRPHLETSLTDLIYSEDAEESVLSQTRYTQPALFSIEYALYQLWTSWGIRPSVMMGHSVGEYVAACAAGVFSLEDGLKLISERARLMQALPAGGEMAAVMADEARVTTAILPYAQAVSIAAVNGPKNIVISGEGEDIKAVCAAFQAEGIKTTALKVSHAFHSSLMEPMLADFERVCREVSYSSPHTDIVSNVTGNIATDEITTPEYWVKHVRQAVRFADSMSTLHEQGYEIFVEAGPKPVLLGMGRNCLPKATGLWLPSLRPKRPDWQQMLQSLGELYKNGADPDWTEFYREYPGHRVMTLPNYPFQRERYWVDMPLSLVFRCESERVHPLLDKKISSPLLRETLFESLFSAEAMPFLNDHRIFDEVVVSAASHLSLLLGAAELTFGDKGCILEDVLFLQVLSIPQDESRTIQVAVTPDKSATAFKVISFESESSGEDDDYTIHVTGNIRLLAGGEQVQGSELSIQKIWERCQEEMDASEIYDMQAHRGILLGPSYHWIDVIRRGNNEAVCRMKVPEILKEESGYQLHPGLIDSCFGLLVTTTDIETDETYIPFSIRQFTFYRHPEGSELWAYACVREISEEGKLSGDIQLSDRTGHLIAEFKGLEGRKATREAILRGLRKNFSDWLYEVRWIEDTQFSVELSQSSGENGNWLIFCDKNSIGTGLAERLEEQGEHCLLIFSDQINPQDPQAFQSLFAENPGPFRGVVYLTEKEDSQFHTTLFSLRMIQAMVAAGWSDFPRVWLVTQGAQPANQSSTADLHVSIFNSPLWGLARGIAFEHPEFRCVCVDLDPSGESDRNAQILFEELRISDDEDRIVWHKGVRHVARLASYQLPKMGDDAADNGSLFDENASYLITGGLGGLGLCIARWMTENGTRHLVLTGRSGASTPETQEAVSQLEAQGVTVLVVKADVSLQEDVVRIFGDIKATMPPLKGIIHGAGVLDDGMLMQQNWERFQRVMAPKAEGAWHLHTLTLNMELDFFVCFSSIVSLFGSTAQANYAAANAFLDALAHHRRAMGLPGLSINWGPWAEKGMAASLDKRDQQRIAEQGLTSIPPEQGVQILGELLRQDIAQVGVLSVNWPKFMRHFFQGVKWPFLEEFTQSETQTPTQEPLLLKELKAAQVNERRPLLIEQVRSLIAEVLGSGDPERIGLRQRLFDLGIDSLMAVDLKNRLEAALGLTLRSTLVFDYPMVEAIADHLLGDVLSPVFSDSDTASEETETDSDALEAELDQLSEAEAEAMLLKEIEMMDV